MWKVSHETDHCLTRKIRLKLVTHKVNARYIWFVQSYTPSSYL
jgi:hypothetical protein